MSGPPTLGEIVRRLRETHGEIAAPAFADPFHWILWEQVAYLADDARRRRAFDRLAAEIGLEPEAILAAPLAALTEIATSGGRIAAEKRAGRMRASARRVVERWGGDLRGVLGLPEAEAVRELRRFPMIGRPGAEKILLLTRARAVPALDSNGLRVLLRLGYGEVSGRYESEYSSVRASIVERGDGADLETLVGLHHLIRRHGREVCRNRAPACARCPLTDLCAWFAEHSTTPSSPPAR